MYILNSGIAIVRRVGVLGRLHVALWLVGAVPAVGSAQTGLIFGSVWDSATNAPLGQVLVVLAETPKRAVSDHAGAFRLDGLAAGVHRVVAYRLGYMPTTATAVLESGTDTARVDFLLAAGPAGMEIAIDVEPRQPPCGIGRSRAPEWIQSLDPGSRRNLGLDETAELRGLENTQLCSLLYAVAVQHILATRRWKEWEKAGGSLPDWSLVVSLALRLGSTAILDLGVYEPSMFTTPDPDRPRVPDTRIFVTVSLVTLEVIGTDTRSW